MGRGLARRPRTCGEHPHRAALDRCDECLRHFCAECFVREGERLLCRPCRTAAPLRAAEAARRRRLGDRLRHAAQERLGGLIAAGLVVGLLASAAALSFLGGGAGAGAISQALADEPLVRHRIAAGRYCAGGDGSSGDVPQFRSGGDGGSPVARTADTGALIVVVAGVLPDTVFRDERLARTLSLADPSDPMNLVRYRDANAPGWRSPSALFPQQIGYELRGQAEVERVAFRHTRATPPETWAREVALLVSTEGPDRGFYSVRRWTLAQTTEPQEFLFWETPARYVRVCVYSNYGSSEFASLGNLALGIKTNDFRAASSPLLPPASPGRAFVR